MQAKLLLIELPRGRISPIGGSRQTESARRGALAPVAREPTCLFARLAEGRERIDALAGPRR